MITFGSEAGGCTGALRRIGRSIEWYSLVVGGGGGTGATCIDEGIVGLAHR